MAIGLLLTGSAQPAAAAAGDPPLFQVPFECGVRVYGQTNHSRGYDGKPGTDDDNYYSIDFNDNRPRYDSDRGMRVVASSAGRTIMVDKKLHGDADDYGIVIVDHGSGWLTLYAHLRDRVPVGTPVEAGDYLGRVSDVAPMYVRNHLHYQQLHRKATVPARFGGVPYAYYPRPGKYLKSRNCLPPDEARRREVAQQTWTGRWSVTPA